MHIKSIPTQQNIKAMHQKEIYLMALHNMGVSRVQLKNALDLSFPSITALVEELLSLGVLTETGAAESPGRGRPQILLNVNPASLTIPVVSVGPTGYRCALYDCCAHLLEETTLPFREIRKDPDDGSRWTPSLDAVVQPISEWINRVETQYHLSDLVISFPGNANEDGILSSSALHLTLPKDLILQLSAETGLKIIVGNNADYYAFAEKIWQKLPRDYIYFYVGKGVGAGIVRKGKVFGAGAQRAGEVGHMSVDYQGRACSCGGRGCLERYICTDAILEDVQVYSGRKFNDFTEICSAYLYGDPDVRKVMHDKADLIAIGINNMLVMQPVTHVVLGGSIARLGDEFLQEVRSRVQDTGFRKYMDRVSITYACGTAECDSLGALWNYIENQMQFDVFKKTK